MITYFGDDTRYNAWLDSHQDGFVVISFRTPDPSYLMLHSAKCPQVQPSCFDDKSKEFYSKNCANSEDAARRWATLVGGQIVQCDACLSKLTLDGVSIDAQLKSFAKSSISYANLRAYQIGFHPSAISEYLLYSDAQVISDIAFGPYHLFSLSMPIVPELKPAIALRAYHCLPPFPEDPWIKTDTSRYHGGTWLDEVAALVSLCLGIRLKAGPLTRVYTPRGDPKGHPVGWGSNEVPSWSAPQDGYIIPDAANWPKLTNATTGEFYVHPLTSAESLQNLTQLNPRVQ
jgi:hypothetical protein